MSVDFEVIDEGSVWVFRPLTETAKGFADMELGLEPWQRWAGGSFVIDQRPARDLVQALIDEGFEVSGPQ